MKLSKTRSNLFIILVAGGMVDAVVDAHGVAQVPLLLVVVVELLERVAADLAHLGQHKTPSYVMHTEKPTIVAISKQYNYNSCNNKMLAVATLWLLIER